MDVTKVIVFLDSEEAGGVTGSTYTVDCGGLKTKFSYGLHNANTDYQRSMFLSSQACDQYPA